MKPSTIVASHEDEERYADGGEGLFMIIGPDFRHLIWFPE